MSEKCTNEMVIIIRPSFKKLCGPDACRAALYNHILYRLARKAKDESEAKVKAGDVFWYASAEDICQDMDEAWCVNKVRKEIKQLVADGLLGQRHNPSKGWDRKYQYFIGPSQGEKLLEKTQEKEVCLLHIGLNAEVTHLLHMVNAFNKNGACICHKEEMDLPDMADASTKNGGAIPKGSTKGSSEESTEGSEGTYPRETTTPQIGDSAPSPAPQSQDESYVPDFTAHQQGKPASQASEQDSVALAESSTSIPPSGKAVRAVTQPPSQQNKTNKVSSAAPGKPARAQLTLLGGQVRTDYETIRACRLRLTEKNINALNTLGELDGMNFVNLKETIELIEGQSIVKERNIPIDPQALASEDGYWRFDKWYQVVLRNRKQQSSKSSAPPPTSASLPSFSDMSDEEFYTDARNYSNLRKGSNNARATYAR